LELLLLIFLTGFLLGLGSGWWWEGKANWGLIFPFLGNSPYFGRIGHLVEGGVIINSLLNYHS